MPLASGLGIHDDTKHKGSAKRAIADGVAPLDAASKVPVANVPDILPTGVILPFGAAAAPTGYILCNGAAISRTTYAALFGVIGDAYGVGDGSTTFNLPDLQGGVPVGIGASGVVALGDVGGAQEHTLVVGEMPAHTHNVSGTVYDLDTLYSGNVDWGKGNLDTSSAGGDLPHNNMQPYQGVNYIIKL